MAFVTVSKVSQTFPAFDDFPSIQRPEQVSSSVQSFGDNRYNRVGFSHCRYDQGLQRKSVGIVEARFEFVLEHGVAGLPPLLFHLLALLHVPVYHLLDFREIHVFQ